MDNPMYRLYDRQKNKRRRRVLWFCLIIILIILICSGIIWLKDRLNPQVVIKQTNAVTTQVSYNSPTKVYNEPGFSIALPNTWQLLPKTPSEYQMYTWEGPNRETDGQELTVYINTIPENMAVNHVLVVQGENDQLTLDGTASENCTTFTSSPALPNSTGAPAEWSGVSFLCDQANPERDVVGTSSSDGVNTVILKNLSTGISRKFFFTFTDDSIDPDYTVFYNALQSVRSE